MAEGKDNVVRIDFGVKGGGDIDGASGRRINRELKKIASQIELSIKVGLGDKDIDQINTQLQNKFKKKGASPTIKIGAEIDVKDSLDNILSTESEKQKETLKTSKDITKEIKKWIEYAREYAKATTSGFGDAAKFKENADNIGTVLKTRLGENDTLFKEIEDKVKNIMGIADAKATAKAEGNLQLRWERATAGANSLNERYVDLIKNSKEARAAIDALYTKIREGQLKLGQKITDSDTGEEREANIGDITKQTEELELLYKKTSSTMSTLEAKSHTLRNKIKETFNSKLLQSFSYALVGLLTGALRKVYTNVVELDGAITDLQIATGKTRDETTKLVQSYADLAKQLGATMTEVAEGADTWLRQGYSIEETTQLISDSMKLSKLGQLEAAEASKALTSAMKGYKVEVEDALSIVDKFTAVDMAAATSAGDIATAMAETAASANVAGVSMDRLIGYISTVAEVTQDGAESVGTFYKTLFARMGNVKTGRFIDGETGERLNDVEGTLSTLGIELRSSNDTFRDFGEVLDEVGAKWNSYTNVQQHAIATAFAGTRQQEKFIVLMENYAQAMEYANIAAESEGTATSKYNAAYLDSIEAKVNELTAAWQGFSMSLLDTTAIKNVVDMLSMFVSWLDAIVSVGNGQLLPFLVAIPIVLATVRQAFKDTGNAALTTGQKIAQGLKNSIPVVIPTILAFIATFDNAEAKISTAVIGIATAVIAALTLITMAVKKFEMSNPIGWILAAISAVLMAIQAITDLIPSYEKSKKAAEEARAAWDENSQALEENASKIEELKSELEELNSIENKSITDQNDIIRLEREIALLNERNAVLKKQEENLKSTAADAAVEAYQQLAYGKITGTELEGADSVKHWMKTNDLDMSSEELVNYALANWNAVENGVAVIPDSVRTFVTGYLNEVNTLTDGLERGIDPTLDRILDIADRANEVFYLQEEGIEAYWQNLGLKGEYANGIEAIEDFANGFKKSTDITGRALKDFAKDNADAMAIFEHLKEVGAWDGKNWESLAAHVQDLRTGLGELAMLSISDDIELVSTKFDALSNAIAEAKEKGVLSLDTLKTLMEETPNELDKYFEKMADGYGLKEQYQGLSSFDLMREVGMAEIKDQQEALATAQDNLRGLTEEDDDYEIAQKNLAAAQDNLNTKTMEWATILRDLKVEEETEKLEKKKEALEEQLDIYKELVDIRKDILETYQEEVSYQKELNRKQANVATLQAQLSAARLDNSAEGEARQRELENELQAAQEELDEYTLERAIQDITVSMDNEYAEYEAFIQEEVEKITNQIEGIATTVKQILGEVSGYVALSDGASDMYTLYKQIKNSSNLNLGGSATSQSKFMAAMQNNDYGAAAQYYREASSWYNDNKPTEPEVTTTQPEINKISPNDLKEIQGAQAYNFNYKDVNDFGHVLYEGSKYRLERAAVGSDELLAAAKEKRLDERAVFKYGNNVYAMTDGGNHVIKLKDRRGIPGDQLQYFKNATGIFHQGGFIGDFMALKSNEQFAKLLKGEFVTTPAQMDNFMKKVLPQITSYSNGATINNNSPLIAIQCGSINDETLPKLAEMVDAAVAQIERNMENALTRRGYRGRV